MRRAHRVLTDKSISNEVCLRAAGLAREDEAAAGEVIVRALKRPVDGGELDAEMQRVPAKWRRDARRWVIKHVFVARAQQRQQEAAEA